MQYPPIKDSASILSAKSQRGYKTCMKVHLGCLSAASLLVVLNSSFPHLRIAVIVIVVIAIVSFVLTRELEFNETWFDARAIAESVKTSSWRFSMKAEPFPSSLKESELRERFADEMKQITSEAKNAKSKLDYSKDLAMAPTKEMLELRSARFEVRKSKYLNERVRNQRDWYSNNSAKNRRKLRILSIIVFVLNAAVLLTAAFSLDWSCVLLTCASSAVAFLQLEQYSQLSHSYGVAANELAHIEQLVNEVKTDEKLSELVDQAEMAMSREHTLWVSRNAY